MLDAAAPKVAGEDTLDGGAKNPSQFDEPDEDALEEMAELLGEDDED
jgi:putative methionine-R-sulfoxide reductase with GAF domain